MCPAVLKSDDGPYVIIGTTLDAHKAGLAHRVAPHETAVEISDDLLEHGIIQSLRERNIMNTILSG
jgi:hypothetical protein